MRKNNQKITSENDLIQETKDALKDVLGREPTEKEILRVHASFKRMAFLIYEYLKIDEKQL